jgi:enoyl-CoA hydratase/carnithine racemase
MDVFCVVVVNQGPFWSNGLDLAWVDANDEKSNKAFVLQVNKLMEKVLTFPIPTVGAMNGHWCAAGGMLGLCFDYRVMNEDRGYFFIPAVDLGIVYSAFQIELMKSKLPMYMHREIICFNAKRWTAKELQQNHVVDDAAPKGQVLKWALKLATTLLTKGKGPARKALKPIKERVYAQVLATLVQEEGGSMQFGGRKSGANYAAPPSRL